MSCALTFSHPFPRKLPGGPCRLPKGIPILTLCDALGTIFQDDDFTDLYSHEGQPGLSAWRLALVTIMQFAKTLSAATRPSPWRARIDWKYLLSLDLSNPASTFPVLSECRDGCWPAVP